jgi:ADP-dependent NAD(P)H-hydrate dehydratase / NAD(P)H-hydrate epimerase
MSLIDRRAQDEFAIPSQLLMEDAGVAAWALFVRRECAGRVPPGPLVFVAGKGNNAGDAFVMARRALCQGARSLSIVLAGGKPREGSPAQMLAICEAYGIECLLWDEDREQALVRLREADWILDGIAGTGLRGALRPPLSDLVEAVNASRGRRAAIDVPSGVSDSFRTSWPAVRADVTLAMGLPKLCLYLPHARALCGRIFVVPVGFPPALVSDPSIPGEMLSFGAWRKLMKPIPADTHKNRRGHLAVFAGAPGTTGAAWLSASAAARSRLGLVSLYAGRDVYPILAQKATSIMVKPWDEPQPPDWGGPDLGPYTGVLVGPGWGLAEGRERWLERLLAQNVSGTIDADGIALLSRISARRPVDLGGRWVLTPHPGEFARISGVPRDDVLLDPLPRAQELASRLNGIVVLKSHCTIVVSPSGRHWIMDGPNAALATGGSGDVLAGLVAAGIAGGLSPLDGALFGVSLHACLGRAARRRMGWFLAEDLVPLLSPMLR